METWKDIEGYDGKYQVSDLGNVRSVDHITTYKRNGKSYVLPKKGMTLKPLIRQHGYLCVQLYGRSQSSHARGIKTVSIHRLVAEAFIDNPNCLPEVNHKNEDKTDNRVSNLEWTTHLENTRYGTGIQRSAVKRINGKRSRAVNQYTRDGQFVKAFPSLAEVNRQLGFAQGNILKCANHNEKYNHAYGYKWEWA